MCIPSAIMLELHTYGHNITLNSFRLQNTILKVDTTHANIGKSHDEISLTSSCVDIASGTNEKVHIDEVSLVNDNDSVYRVEHSKDSITIDEISNFRLDDQRIDRDGISIKDDISCNDDDNVICKEQDLTQVQEEVNKFFEVNKQDSAIESHSPLKIDDTLSGATPLCDDVVDSNDKQEDD